MTTTITAPAPPVAERPRCPACGKSLQPSMHVTHERNGLNFDPFAPRSSAWTGRYKSYGAFCTLRCCEAYANEMFTKHGTRYTLVKAAP